MMFFETPVTFTLLAANILISALAFQNEAFMKRNLFIVGPILRQREYHRLISSGFLHLNLMHLFFNMYVLYGFGRALEADMGSAQFAGLYSFSLLGGSLWSLMENRRNLLYSALGASGATSGIVMAYCFRAPSSTLELFFAIAMPAWFLALLFFGVSVLLARRPNKVIGHDAHLGGMMFGGAYFLLYEPRYWAHFIATIEGALGLG